MNIRSLPFVSACVLQIILSGCTSANRSLQPRVDESTGEVLVTMRNAIALARKVPSLSTTARDYVYLGPVEVDLMGGQEFYLWVGVASTIDRAMKGESTMQVNQISVHLDEETLHFSLMNWPIDAIVSPYSVSAPLSQSLRTRVTLEELDRFSEARSLEVTLSSDSGESYRYAYWRGRWPEWTVLAEDTEFGFAVKVH